MQGRPSVLLVDDDPEELELLAIALEPLGVETVTASGADEALTKIDGRRFAAAILDLLMPRLNGFETAALLRARDKALPILILTGYDEQGSRRLPGWERVAGSVRFMEKPFSGTELRRRVEAAYSATENRSSGRAPSR